MDSSFHTALLRIAGPSTGQTRASDGELVSRFRETSAPEAFAELVRRHAPMVFGVCRRMLPCRQDAEDALQATFLVLAVKAHTVRPPERVGAWLHGVAHRAALKARRDAARRARAERVAAGPRQAPQPLDFDVFPILDEVLLALPEKYRLPVVECHLAGRSRKEAAARLGCSEGTLSGRLARALDLLAARLTRRGVRLPAVSLAGALAARQLAAVVPVNRTASILSLAGLVRDGILPSTGASPLTRGVLNTMWWNKRAALSALGLAVGALIAALGFLGSNCASADPVLPGPSRLTERPLRAAAPVPKFRPQWEEKHTLVCQHPVVEIVAQKEFVVLADEGGNILRWKPGTNETGVLSDYIGRNTETRPIALLNSTRDGSLCFAAADGTVAGRYDLLTRSPLSFFAVEKPSVFLGFSDNGKTWIETVGEKRSVVRLRTNLWADPDARSEDLRFDAAVTHTVFAPNETRLAAITADGKIHIIDRNELKIVRSIEVKNLRAKAIRFSPDDGTLAVVGENGFARLYDAPTGRLAVELKGLKGVITDVAFSPDGKSVATAGDDYTAHLWEAKTGEPVAILKGHKDAIRVVRFGQDSTKLITGSDDKTLKVWGPRE
jgi:RNA polymerase sigma factor (sigma-70 family)